MSDVEEMRLHLRKRSRNTMKNKSTATSANLGPGFDSCGIALSAYLTINVFR